MSSKGLGNDIIEIDRIRKSIERHGIHFLNRVFTQKEQDYCYQFKDPVPHFAARWAAKEAVAKAFGTGFGADLGWHDIEILNDDKGKPIVHLSTTIQRLHHNPHLLLSMSHCTSYASAVVIWDERVPLSGLTH